MDVRGALLEFAMKLRRGTERDLERLVAIEAACFDPSRYAPMSRRQFRHHLSSSNAIVIVAEDDAGVAQGYALGLLHARRKAIRFYSLAVAPDAQRGDLGRVLFESIEAEARGLGLAVQCEVRSDNEKLKDRYTRLGYVPYRTVEGYYPDGASCIKYVRTNI